MSGKSWYCVGQDVLHCTNPISGLTGVWEEKELKVLGGYVVPLCFCSDEFEAYKKEKALAAVNSRSGKKLTPQVSINPVTIRLLATVPPSLTRHTHV